MKSKARLNLSKLGLSGLEIDALDKIIDIVNGVNSISDNNDYSRAVNALIREKYSLSQELSILRQRDDKPEQYKEYSDYVEECKEKAKNGNI